MARWALGLEYDGAGFSGWQRQPAPVRTIQAELEAALSQIAVAPVVTVCAGRTDAGVHASMQVVHFDCPEPRPETAWVRGANGLLPEGLRIVWARQVDADFHARFEARSRRYRYIIHNGPHEPAILRRGLAWYRKPLDIENMQQAAQYLLGCHDFSSFRAAGCQFRSPHRRIEHLAVLRRGVYVIVDIIANSFLLHMVRNIVGSLYLIGDGRQPPRWLHELLLARNRTLGGDTAESGGLYLVDVEYPPVRGLPRLAPGPRWLHAHECPLAER